MLIVNSRALPTEPIKGHDLYKYSVEYRDGIDYLEKRFPERKIQLKRAGYPRVNKSPDGSTLPEIAPPIMIKLTATDKGVTWSYVDGRPAIPASGLMEPRETANHIQLDGEVIQLDLYNDPEYAFFFWFKSKQVGTNFEVYDPAGDEVRNARKKQERKRVESLIWSDFDENKVKLMCEANGISITSRGKEIDIALLRQKLEDKVFAMEEVKQRDKTNLMAKGIVEFLADAKADEFTRPKAIIQRAVDEKVLTYKAAYFYIGDLKIECFIPIDHQGIDKRQEYLAKHFRTTDDGDKWTALLQAVVDKPFIDSLDKYGTRWLAEQMGIRLNQQADVIKQQLYEKFGIKVVVPDGTSDE